jgi:hypothetical protein
MIVIVDGTYIDKKGRMPDPAQRCRGKQGPLKAIGLFLFHH